MVRQHSRTLGVLPVIVLVAASILAAGAEEISDLGHVVGLARVTYVSGSSIYIDAGREHGLESGQTLEVLRDGQSIGQVRVDNISAIRASCKIVQGEQTLAVGDLVRLPIPGDGSESIRSFDEGIGSFVVHPTPDETTAGATDPAEVTSGTVDTSGNPGLARVSHVDQNRVLVTTETVAGRKTQGQNQ